MSHLSLLLLALALVAAPWEASAQGKANFVNISRTMDSPQLYGKQINMSPYGMPSGCTAIGVCVPFNFTLPNRTLWTWCGWSTTQRTDYLISASGTISAQLMKSPALTGCATPNLAKMSSCESVFQSGCGGRACTMRVLALAYSDEACLVIGNSDPTKSVTVGVQVFQYYDSPRYYGTIFSIILAIIMIGGVALYIGYTCYKEITTPPDRLHELRSFEAQLERSETVLGKSSEPDRDASDPGSFQGRVKTALTKAKNLVLRKGASQA